MICKECGKEMILDDKDVRFKGCLNKYWICSDENCSTSCIEEIRFSQSFRELWHSENNEEVKDWIIKHNITRS